VQGITKDSLSVALYRRLKGNESDEEIHKIATIEEEKKGYKMSREEIYKVARKGTIESAFFQIAQEISHSYLPQTLNDYISMFFFDKDSKRVLFDQGTIKDQDEREFKKFV
jgi:hypothetical protein